MDMSKSYCFCYIIYLAFVFSLMLLGNNIRVKANITDEADYFKNFSFNQWTWVCNDKQQCEQKQLIESDVQYSLKTCNMLCGTPPLWPKPKLIDIASKSSSAFSKYHVFLKLHAPPEVKNMLEKAANIFLDNLVNERSYLLKDGDEKLAKLNIHVRNAEQRLSIHTNESYELFVQNIAETIHINIFAGTYFGARHALETLTQLIWYDTVSKALRILHDVKITDSPAFPHRGLSIDTARNFFSIDALKRAINGMAASKLNVLHLHLTDSQSFPVVLPHNPEFAENGAYSSNMTYTPEDIQMLIEYANVRGIRTILEIDAPTHVNRGWPKDLVICGDNDVTNGHLNPDNPHALDVLQVIYEDLLEIGSNNETFHIGGDEVNLKCWRNTEAGKNYTDLHLFWVQFSNLMLERVKAANKDQLPENVVLWSSPLTDRYLNQLKYKDHIVVQFWLGAFDHILNDGYKIIFSTVGHWYLDCGFGPWRPDMVHGVCDPYTPWQTFYKYRPWETHQKHIKQVLGGEACLWSEQVSEDDLETRLWPRAAAFAERVWSDIQLFDDYDVYTRLVSHSDRLKSRGIKTAAMWPEWCSLNPGKC